MAAAAVPLIQLGVNLALELMPEVMDAVKAYHIAHARYPSLTSAQIAQIDTDNSDTLDRVLADSDSKVSGLVIPPKTGA